MKTYWTLAFALPIVACSDPPPTPKAEPEVAQATAADAKPVEAEVILQGLMAFVETTDDGRPVVDALFANALKGLIKPPKIVSHDAIHNHHMHLPPHEPFVAVENGVIGDCFIDTSAPRVFELAWESNKKLKAYPLCAAAPCGEHVLSLGTSDFGNQNIDLDKLVDAGDFGGTCGDQFLTLADNPDLTAQVRLDKGRKIDAEVLGCSDTFGFLNLTGDQEGACAGSDIRLAEQVAVLGSHPVKLKRGAEICLFSPENPGEPMRIWLFNVNSYAYENSASKGSSPHHPAFYWYYDLAPESCGGAFPRPCPDGKENSCFGDPKCPQIGLKKN